MNPNLLKHIKKEWKEVLDIGCSSGALGVAIKENGTRVSGIEAFPEAENKQKEKLDHVVLGDIETMDMPYEEEQFDCVIFGDVLEHLFDPWAVIEKSKAIYKRKWCDFSKYTKRCSHFSISTVTCWKLDVYRIWFIR